MLRRELFTAAHPEGSWSSCFRPLPLAASSEGSPDILHQVILKSAGIVRGPTCSQRAMDRIRSRARQVVVRGLEHASDRERRVIVPLEHGVHRLAHALLAQAAPEPIELPCKELPGQRSTSGQQGSGEQTPGLFWRALRWAQWSTSLTSAKSGAPPCGAT